LFQRNWSNKNSLKNEKQKFFPFFLSENLKKHNIVYQMCKKLEINDSGCFGVLPE